jgi:hypothetical protein
MKPELPIKKHGVKRENVTRENHHSRFTHHGLGRSVSDWMNPCS